MITLVRTIIRKVWPSLYRLMPKSECIRKLNRRIELSRLKREDIVSWRIEKAKDIGIKVGKNCRFYSLNVYSEPYLVEIGDNVIVSGEVMFITHDGSVYTFKDDCPDIFGRFGPIKIGNNCFIGMRAIILPNVKIGNNCIVGAGAVVTRSFPDNCLIVGNPATCTHKITSLKKVVLRSKNTLRSRTFHFPNEKEIPEDIKKAKLLKHFNME